MSDPRWTWNRDGEFFFRDASADISGNISSRTGISVAEFSVDSGACDSVRLETLIHQIRNELPGYELRVHLNSEIIVALVELAAQNRIDWKILENPFSKIAEIRLGVVNRLSE